MLSSQLLMIRPVNFGFNTQTAGSNAFQQQSSDDSIQEKALEEFDALVEKLRANGIDVLVLNDTPDPHTPDSIFPNNWISFHEDGSVVLYPMFAPNRRLERKRHLISEIQARFGKNKTVDLTVYEDEDKFLEGTGSMVLDRKSRIAYACRSPRTDEAVLNAFCTSMGYTAVVFNAIDEGGKPIYHTNVMMCVGDQYVVICLDSIRNPEEKNVAERTIRSTGKQIVPITYLQLKHFAGNMLQVQNRDGEKILVMSSQAFHSLTDEQKRTLSGFNRIIHSPLDVIESNGGGSARCMMAEVL